MRGDEVQENSERENGNERSEKLKRRMELGMWV